MNKNLERIIRTAVKSILANTDLSACQKLPCPTGPVYPEYIS